MNAEPGLFVVTSLAAVALFGHVSHSFDERGAHPVRLTRQVEILLGALYLVAGLLTTFGGIMLLTAVAGTLLGVDKNPYLVAMGLLMAAGLLVAAANLAYRFVPAGRE